ncbi:DUF1294 domain-containing protein [Oceanobacillus halophilus]|uniref:DUF1294 domain-containing protein n=1 Tax=Oceanobacillus halophilus TaxID=930130 RepID=A0A494ZUF1_9BACI|nr:DUF1294 domain-containing protein [Oceanobacillus halophilus]RKQ29925.1 DUF1294 domain-containing protein [Oceanobacillus halophilus]
MNTLNMVLFYIIGVNIIGFFLMRVDKQKAIKQKYRIPERTFWLIALFGGAAGTYAGMKSFRHKTKHTSFIVGMPIVILLNIGLYIYLLS